MVTWAKKLNIPIGARKIKNFPEPAPQLSTMSVLDTVVSDKEINNKDKRKASESPRKVVKAGYRYSAKRRRDPSKDYDLED